MSNTTASRIAVDRLQIAAAEEDVDRLTASKASAQAEADEADAAAQQALETGHAEVRTSRGHGHLA